MSTEKMWIFEPHADSEFCVLPAKERYKILIDMIDDGMPKSDAIDAYEGLHLPDEQHEEYLKKLKEY